MLIKVHAASAGCGGASSSDRTYLCRGDWWPCPDPHSPYTVCLPWPSVTRSLIVFLVIRSVNYICYCAGGLCGALF